MENVCYNAIKNWAEEDRPREKLLEKGAPALTNAELLAILIGSGSRNESAVDLCKRVLASVDNNLNLLGRKDVASLMNFKGIGEAKALTIVAAMELSRRRVADEAIELPVANDSTKVYNVMRPLMCDLPHEEIWAIFLNKGNKIMDKRCFFKGGIDKSIFDSRIIIRVALDLSASSIILVHNHPSGNPEPSADDKNLTKKFKSACDIMDITLLDHVIVASNNYFSFADELMLC